MITTLISRVHVGAVVAFMVAIAALIGVRQMLPSPKPVAPARSTPRGDLPLRMASAGTLVFVLTSVAERLGSSVSGILTPFPTATAILAGFTHAQRGSAACVEFIRAFIPGLCGFAVFCVMLALTLPRMSTVWAFCVALAVQLILQTALFSAEASRSRR